MDEKEFISIYEKFSDPIFRHCYFRLYNYDRTKDLMQECFMKTWKYVVDGHTIDMIKPFLYKVANNLIYNEARKKFTDSLELLRENGFEPGREDREVHLSHLDGKAAVETLKKLRDLYRAPVLMKFIDGFSIKEIAIILDESENVVSVRIHRGLKQLRILIEGTIHRETGYVYKAKDIVSAVN
ncbi:MAG: RNA polymerase sigma factor [bacterium]